MESLALKYRPRTFDDLVGQSAVQVVLRKMVEKDRVPQAILLDGPRGTGKTTTARILAASLNCTEQPVPCGHCPSCKAVYDGTSLDVREIDAASHGLVEDIRGLRDELLYDVGGSHRVVLLDEAHSCSRSAFDAMLKMFEEPPINTVFVLLTTEPSRIPETVLSRLHPFTFRRIGIHDIVNRLQHIADTEGYTVEPELLTAIATKANGGLRDAIMTLDQLLRVDITTLAGYRELTGDHDFAPTLIAALAAGKTATAYKVAHDQLQRTGDATTISNALTCTLRDMLILATGGELDIQGQPQAARKALAAKIDKATTVAAMRVLWNLKTQTRVTDDPRICLDLAIAMLSTALRPQPTPAPAGAASSGPRLTLDQMAGR